MSVYDELKTDLDTLAAEASPDASEAVIYHKVNPGTETQQTVQAFVTRYGTDTPGFSDGVRVRQTGTVLISQTEFAGFSDPNNPITVNDWLEIDTVSGAVVKERWNVTEIRWANPACVCVDIVRVERESLTAQDNRPQVQPGAVARRK